MAVDNPDVVDAIGIEQATGVVVLTISDHLEWNEDNDHLPVLQAKINGYLAFIESGQLVEAYPQAVARPLRIDVVCRYQPSGAAERFLNAAREMVENAGASFVWRVPRRD